MSRFIIAYIKVALFDSLFVVMIVSLAVVAIVRETQISSIGYQNYPGYNQGAFAAAGVVDNSSNYFIPI